MIAEVKRQPRSNRRTPLLDKPRDKPGVTNISSYILLPFPQTSHTFPEAFEELLPVDVRIHEAL